MSILNRVADWLSASAPVPPMMPGLSTAQIVDTRSYVVGPSVVAVGEERWGHDVTESFDANYLDYISTSNNVYVCIQKRSAALSSLPITLYKGTDKNKRKEVVAGGARTLLDSVNPWMTLDRLLTVTEQHLCLSGQAFWFLERGTSARRPPTEIWPVRPDLVKIVPDTKNFIAGFMLHPENGGEPIAYSVDEVIWFAYPHPKDPYAGLAPLSAARLAADTASAAMHSNKAIFANGTRVGGVLSPADNGTITEEQAAELQQMFSKFKGASKAHLMAVLAYNVKFQQWNMTPKDAEFLGALDLTLEEIARAFGIAPDLLGGSKRTYQNAPEARYAFWADTIKSEAQFIQNVITERLLPMFPGEADAAEFDFDDVDALKENEDSVENRWKQWIADGRKTINEWRADQGDKPVPWGDDHWIQAGMVPIGGPMADDAAALAEEAAQAAQLATVTIKELPPGDTAADDAQDGQGDAERGFRTRNILYGSPDHERLATRFLTRTDPHEKVIADTTARLMRSQRQAILVKLKAQDLRSFYGDGQRLAVKDLMEAIFILPRWIRRFREDIRPVLTAIVDETGAQAMDDLATERGMTRADVVGIVDMFDVSDPNVVRFLVAQAQRFAREVNETTWDMLKTSLGEGLENGEGIDDLAKRVEEIMAERIRSSAEVIARTETTSAANGGTMLSWQQSGVVRGKRWLAAKDSRTRKTHSAAHGQTVALDADFHVGGATGPGPGMLNLAEEVCNCRCSLTAVLDTDEDAPRSVGDDVTILTRIAQGMGVAS